MLADLVILVGNLGMVIDKFSVMVRDFRIHPQMTFHFVTTTTARHNPTSINTDLVGATNLDTRGNVTCKKLNAMSL
jgi:hypothetical protein